VNILGISAFYHDSAACLVRDGEIIAAAQEERFTRKKHDPGFPHRAVEYCLNEGRIGIQDLQYIVFYDKPLIKFERLLETYVGFAPRGLQSFLAAMPVWLKEKLLLRNLLRKEIMACAPGLNKKDVPQFLFGEHHESHAASAFFPSPYQKAAVLCMDGVGEWATTSAWLGDGNSLTPLWDIPFPHSIGLLYSAFTYYTGFKVNSGEYKVMGLAPYGQPKYVKGIYEHLLDLKPDGTFRMNMEFFNYCTGLTMTNSRFDDLFGGPPRKPESKLGQREMDLARSIQEVTEEVMLRLSRTMHRETGAEYLCLAGGVALNCVGNGRILREGPFKDIWIQPAAGDAGGAVGAARMAGRSGAVAGGGDAVGLDMGGTSCDVSLIVGGAAAVGSGREVGGRALALPMVDVHTVGAGGGSIAWRDSGGALRVGPLSAGADPGPACYGLGGDRPTVTDANLLLGHLDESAPLAGGVRLDRAAAEGVVDRLAEELGLSREDTAAGIARVASAAITPPAKIGVVSSNGR